LGSAIIISMSTGCGVGFGVGFDIATWTKASAVAGLPGVDVPDGEGGGLEVETGGDPDVVGGGLLTAGWTGQPVIPA
jgi:hypothetical protein